MGGGKRHKQKVKKVSESDRVFKLITGSDRFPQCFGKFPDCPEEISQKVSMKFTDEMVPRSCKLCPYFKW